MKRPTKKAPALYLSRESKTQGGDYRLDATAKGQAMNAEINELYDAANALAVHDFELSPEARELRNAGDALSEKYYAQTITGFCAEQFHRATDIRLRHGEGPIKVRIHFRLAK